MKYRPKRHPYAHQQAALRKLLSRGSGGGLLMDPRTGKTQVALDYVSVLNQHPDPNLRVHRVLVVAPLSALGVWSDEIDAVVPDDRDPHKLMWNASARRAKIPLPNRPGALNFVLVNYDAFAAPGKLVPSKDPTQAPQRSKKEGGKFDTIRAIVDWQPDAILLDESHRIKTPSAKRTQMLVKLGQAPSVKYRVIMTGTAVTKKDRVHDIYAQWKFLDPTGWIGMFTAETFKETFTRRVSLQNRSGGKYTKVTALRNAPLLHQQIHKDAFAVKREECFDLPAQRTQLHHVDMNSAEKKAYDELAEDLITKIQTGEISTASIRIVLNMRLAQITSGLAKVEPTPQHPEGRLVRIGTSKLDYLEDRLSDLFEADEKVVVVARFRADIQGVVERCRKLRTPVYELHGGISQRQRDANVRLFREHQGPACFVMQPQVGALAIDLRTAATMIWMSLTDSYVDWDQCNQRIALNPHGTVIEYLLCMGTVDEIKFRSLLEDRDVVQLIHKSPEYLRRRFK